MKKAHGILGQHPEDICATSRSNGRVATMASTLTALAPTPRWIALLGQRDTPTDGVEDYCAFLGQALGRRGIELTSVRVQWKEKGRAAALRQLWRESANWRGDWILLQYTALGWSNRGFPLLALMVQSILSRRAARCAVVFHDAALAANARMRDRVRNALQTWIMRKLFERSERVVLTVPPKTLPWMPCDWTRAAFIPIGANVPEYCDNRAFSVEQSPKTVAVFSVTSGDTRSREVHDIVLAVRRAKERVGSIRLEVFGRGADEARESLEGELHGSGIELAVRGVIPAEEITRSLSAAHVLLCVRGLVTAKRGTAIAAIACGLPVVGYGQPGSDPAIDAAGVRLAPWRDSEALSDELVQVLTDENLWQELHHRNARSRDQYFSWSVVADRYVKLLAANEDLP
jgi:glycosyltransferase involved in cell wall biosynthesis